MGLVGLGQSADGLGRVGSHKMDPWTTLSDVSPSEQAVEVNSALYDCDARHRIADAAIGDCVTEISHLVTRTSSAEPQRARSVAVDTDAGVTASPTDDVTPTGKKTNDNNTVCKYGVSQTDADLARCSCLCAAVYLSLIHI